MYACTTEPFFKKRRKSLFLSTTFASPYCFCNFIGKKLYVFYIAVRLVKHTFLKYSLEGERTFSCPEIAPVWIRILLFDSSIREIEASGARCDGKYYNIHIITGCFGQRSFTSSSGCA